MDEYAKKNGLTLEEKRHLYAMLIASISTAYNSKMWQIAGGTVSLEEAIKKLKQMGYSDEEIKVFQSRLRDNHIGEDKINENDFVHAMGSLSVMLYPNIFTDLMMRFGTSSNSIKSLEHIRDINVGFISLEFIASLFKGELDKNAAATYRGDIASGSLGVQDVRADIDALNIYYRLKNNPKLSMSQVVEQYAKDLQNGGNRAEEIARHLGNGDLEKGKKKFYEEIHKPIDDMGNFTLKIQANADNKKVEEATKDFWKIYERELKGK